MEGASLDKSAERAWLKITRAERALPFGYAHGIRHPLAEGLTCRMHEHPVLEIVHHRRGHGLTRLGDGSVLRFGEGSCVLYAPHVPHDQVMDGPGEDWCVQLALPHRLNARLRGCVLIPQTESWVVEEIDHLSHRPRVDNETACMVNDCRATAVLLALLNGRRKAEPALPPGEHHVRRAESYLRRHFAEIGNLGEVARHCQLSADRLRHLFKQRRGCSLVAFLNQVRVEHAQSLLEHTGLPLKQVATLCGFRDEYYFSNVFKKRTGRPPGSFRQRRAGTV